jgi:hypothetical protein
MMFALKKNTCQKLKNSHFCWSHRISAFFGLLFQSSTPKPLRKLPLLGENWGQSLKQFL